MPRRHSTAGTPVIRIAAARLSLRPPVRLDQPHAVDMVEDRTVRRASSRLRLMPETCQCASRRRPRVGRHCRRTCSHLATTRRGRRLRQAARISSIAAGFCRSEHGRHRAIRRSGSMSAIPRLTSVLPLGDAAGYRLRRRPRCGRHRAARASPVAQLRSRVNGNQRLPQQAPPRSSAAMRTCRSRPAWQLLLGLSEASALPRSDHIA